MLLVMLNKKKARAYRYLTILIIRKKQGVPCFFLFPFLWGERLQKLFFYCTCNLSYSLHDGLNPLSQAFP